MSNHAPSDQPLTTDAQGFLGLTTSFGSGTLGGQRGTSNPLVADPSVVGVTFANQFNEQSMQQAESFLARRQRIRDLQMRAEAETDAMSAMNALDGLDPVGDPDWQAKVAAVLRSNPKAMLDPGFKTVYTAQLSAFEEAETDRRIIEDREQRRSELEEEREFRAKERAEDRALALDDTYAAKAATHEDPLFAEDYMDLVEAEMDPKMAFAQARRNSEDRALLDQAMAVTGITDKKQLAEAGYGTIDTEAGTFTPNRDKIVSLLGEHQRVTRAREFEREDTRQLVELASSLNKLVESADFASDPEQRKALNAVIKNIMSKVKATTGQDDGSPLAGDADEEAGRAAADALGIFDKAGEKPKEDADADVFGTP